MADFILGVAGHVDHGKTSLTYALTGVETDRLAEEKRRGLTIEPGFAPLPLPGGGIAALVDVPGHEKFIHNMLSGTAGLDAVLLTVAADDGVMPQTREHLDICSLLGVKLGLVALTKADLAEESRLAGVTEEIAALTAGTFLEGAPIFPVSSLTGVGMEDLRAAIALLSAQVCPKSVDGLFRMSVDRVFSKDGFGTVVTGTLSDGAVAAGEEAVLYPGGKAVRIRAIQSHGTALTRLEAGHRAALNLVGVERSEVCRGDVLSAPRSVLVTDWVEGGLTLLPHTLPLKTGTRLRLYHGGSELLCRCTLRGQATLSPGERCSVRLRLEAPLVGREGDFFVVRTLSPATTIGGGVLLRLSPPRREAEQPDPLAVLAEYHDRYPLRDGMNRGEFLQRWNGTPALLEELVEQKLIKLRGPVAALPSFRPKYSPELAKIRDKIEVHYRRAGLEPEKNERVDAEMGGEVMAKLVRDGVLLPLGPRHRIHRFYYRRAEERLLSLWERDGMVALSRYRDELGIPRKYALLLLEQFDRAGVTEKRGDSRVVLVDGPRSERL